MTSQPPRKKRNALVVALIGGACFLIALGLTAGILIKYLGSDNKTVVIDVGNQQTSTPLPVPVPVTTPARAGAAARGAAALVPGAPAAAANGTNIGGIVQNEQGIPVAAVRVSVNWITSNGQMRIHHGQRTTTDTSGHWTINGPTKESLPKLQINLQARNYVNSEVDKVPTPESLLDHTAVLVLSAGINITGTVVDDQGQPIAGATIRAGDKYGNNARTTKSSAAGKFTVRHLKPGDLTIAASADGYSAELQSLSANVTPPAIKIALSPGKTMRGRVVDSAGKPIPGVNVSFENWHNTRLFQWRGTTDAQGQFAMPGAPSDTFSMSFNKQGYQSDYEDGLSTAKDAAITLHGSLHVRGTVVDAETGKPIPDFTVTQGLVWNSQQPPTWQPGWNLTKPTGPGKFEFDEDQSYPGYAVRVEARGYYAGDSRVFTADERDVTLAIKLKPGKDLIAMVVDPDGKPAVGAIGVLATPGQNVNIFEGSNNQSNYNNQSIAGPDGRVRFGPQDGAFRLAAYDDKGYAEIDSKQFSDSKPLKLQAWARIEGKLMIGSKPGAHQQMYVQVNPNRVFEMNAIMIFHQISPMTDGNGEFLAPEVPPGAVSVSREIVHQVPGGNGAFWMQTQTQSLNLAPGQTVHLTLGGQGRAVLGRVELPPELIARHDWTFGSQCMATSQESAADAPNAKAAVKNWLNEVLDRGPAPKPPVSYPLEFDGNNFRIDDVAAGTYQIMVLIGQGDWGNIPLATGVATFTIPPMPGGRSDTPLELPAVVVKMNTQ